MIIVKPVAAATCPGLCALRVPLRLDVTAALHVLCRQGPCSLDRQARARGRGRTRRPACGGDGTGGPSWARRRPLHRDPPPRLTPGNTNVFPRARLRTGKQMCELDVDISFSRVWCPTPEKAGQGG